ncbi:MAG TPA: glycosyltransferase family 4 protein [Defluviitaleaceae bacterium]|jgi:glycosyltransferase involved in cell wall biosynthesis|nr:glycosyltransferase family 4 protein [Candidatus Epulonipiscium sp.]HQD50480.1 glycosyltransferase family 4 protein [Defluviitaleaceae bacterium]
MKKIIEIAAVDITIYKFVLPLMKELKKSGFEVHVAAQNVGYTESLGKEGFKVHNVHMPRNLSPIANIKAFLKLISLFKKEKPDIIHTHTPIASILTRLAAKMTGVPKIIYTIHGLYMKFPFTQIEKFMCKYCTDIIFTVNQEDKDYLLENKIKTADKIININSVGVDINVFNPERFNEDIKNRLRQELKIQKKPLIGFVGRMIREKGVLELVEAFVKVRKAIPCQLLLVGSAELGERDENTLKQIKAYIADNKLEQDIIMPGHREDIPELLSIMDIFVLPSYREGMPVSLLEAMAMELPVVATDIRGCREEVDGTCGILVPKADVNSLVKALEYLLKNPLEAKAKGKNGRKRVLDLFTIEESVKKQINYFKD